MSVAEASDQLLQIIEKKNDSILTSSNLAIGLARVGSDSQQIVACSLAKMSKTDLGTPLHCLVIPGKALHPLEVDYLLQFAADEDEVKQLAH